VIVTAHPVGKKKERSIVFTPSIVAAIQSEGVIVPFHDSALIGWNAGLRLWFPEATHLLHDHKVGALGVIDCPGDGAERNAAQRIQRGCAIVGFRSGVGRVDVIPERAFFIADAPPEFGQRRLVLASASTSG